MPDYRITVRRDTAGWTILALILIIGVVASVGFRGPAQAAGGANSTGNSTANLRVVSTMRFVTVSPSKTMFTDCHGGKAPFHSTHTALGYPNAYCWIGKLKSTWPIQIKSSPLGEVLVWGYNALPADGGTQWRLCNGGVNPVVACVGPQGLPGIDQFVVENFWAGGQNPTGLTSPQLCATRLTSSSRCVVSMGQSQSEGLKVVGPSTPHDNSTLWRIRIAWIAVPP